MQVYHPIVAVTSAAYVIQAGEIAVESGSLSEEPPELTLTEIGKLPAIFDALPWSYPQMTPIEPALFEGVDVVWADFTQLPKEFTAIRNYPSYDLHGIRAWPLRLIRFEDTAELVADYPWFEVELVRVPWPKDRKPRCSYDELLRVWAILLGQNPVPYEELLKQGHTLLEPPRSILHFWLADVLDRPVYEYNIASEVFFEATLSLAAEVTKGSGGGMSLLMFGESGSPPCARSKFTRLEVSGDDFVLEWLSETNATYEVAHATDLVVADWVSLATQYPATAGTNVTSFVHSGGATNQTGFYKVAQTGIRILLCDSNTYSGVLDIPIEVGMPNNQELTGIYFLIDGEPTMAVVSPQYPFSGTPTATLDTASISNGWHTVQAFAEYPTGQNEAGGYAEHASQILNVETFNPITFTEMPLTFGTSMPVRASLIVSNADWTVDIFSPSTNLVRAFSGTTTNGVIDFDWDGKDTNGVAFAGEFIQVEVTAIWESEVGLLESGGVTVTNKAGKIIYQEGPMPAFPQGFLVSYQLLFSPGSLSAIQFENMINQLALTIEDEGGGTYVLKGDGTGASSTTKIENTAASWNSWALSLKETSTANLFYFGHGGKDSIGERASDPNKGFFVKEIQTFMGNEIVNKVPKFVVPYRFVFLDGCNSADGNWCIAFGIERKNVPTAEYTKRGIPPRAFMGWTTVKAYAVGGAFNSQHGNFVINFYNVWATQDKTLKQAIAQTLPAGFTAPKILGDEDLKWLP